MTDRMRRLLIIGGALLGIVIVLVIIIGALNRIGTETATVRVTGDSGVPFAGSYGTVNGGATDVDTTSPAEYQIRVTSGSDTKDAVVANFSKQVQDNSTLTVQILDASGEVKQAQTTAAPLGNANVSWFPSRK